MLDRFLDDVQLRKEILKHIEHETFRLTQHAHEEQKKDHLDLQDTLHVLKTGHHEREKTLFDTAFQSWKYAIRGRIEEAKTVRVIVAFAKEMMIITVMKLRS